MREKRDGREYAGRETSVLKDENRICIKKNINKICIKKIKLYIQII